MGRRKKVIDNENLSKETEKVQETVLKDLMNEDVNNSVEAKVETMTSEKPIDLNEVKAEAERAEQARKKVVEKEIKEVKTNELKVGDKVKIKSNVETDMLGRRIHNGIRNYTYNVLAVRPDDFISIECLTYAFLVKKDQVNKI